MADTTSETGTLGASGFGATEAGPGAGPTVDAGDLSQTEQAQLESAQSQAAMLAAQLEARASEVARELAGLDPNSPEYSERSAELSGQLAQLSAGAAGLRDAAAATQLAAVTGAIGTYQHLGNVAGNTRAESDEAERKRKAEAAKDAAYIIATGASLGASLGPGNYAEWQAAQLVKDKLFRDTFDDLINDPEVIAQAAKNTAARVEEMGEEGLTKKTEDVLDRETTAVEVEAAGMPQLMDNTLVVAAKNDYESMQRDILDNPQYADAKKAIAIGAVQSEEVTKLVEQRVREQLGNGQGIISEQDLALVGGDMSPRAIDPEQLKAAQAKAESGAELSEAERRVLVQQEINEQHQYALHKLGLDPLSAIENPEAYYEKLKEQVGADVLERQGITKDGFVQQVEALREQHPQATSYLHLNEAVAAKQEALEIKDSDPERYAELMAQYDTSRDAFLAAHGISDAEYSVYTPEQMELIAMTDQLEQEMLDSGVTNARELIASSDKYAEFRQSMDLSSINADWSNYFAAVDAEVDATQAAKTAEVEQAGLSEAEMQAQVARRTVNGFDMAKQAEEQLRELANDPSLSDAQREAILAQADEMLEAGKQSVLSGLGEEGTTKAAEAAWESLSDADKALLGGDKQAFVENFVAEELGSDVGYMSPEQMESARAMEAEYKARGEEVPQNVAKMVARANAYDGYVAGKEDILQEGAREKATQGMATVDAVKQELAKPMAERDIDGAVGIAQATSEKALEQQIEREQTQGVTVSQQPAPSAQEQTAPKEPEIAAAPGDTEVAKLAAGLHQAGWPPEWAKGGADQGAHVDNGTEVAARQVADAEHIMDKLRAAEAAQQQV